jgi:hypothetical protein
MRLPAILAVLAFLLQGSVAQAQKVSETTAVAPPPPAQEQPAAETAVPDQPAAAPAGKSAPAGSPFAFGATVGSEIIDGKSYMCIGLQPEIVLGKFGAGLDVTLRLDSSFHPYEPDWDNWRDIITKINYIRWGQKRDKLFFKIGLLDEVYLGHGSLFYRYSNKLFLPQVRRIGAQFDADFKSFGWELFDDDVIDNRIFGGRIYTRPFHDSKLFFLKKIAFGVSGAADIDLPKSSVSPYVVLAGADIDVPVFQIPEILEFILYTDFVKNFHFAGASGTGIIPGFMLELFKFRFDGEYHIYQAGFSGPYFDAFYDLERGTKLAALEAQTNTKEGWTIRMGRSIAGWVAFQFDFGADRGDNPAMHFEVNMLKKLMDKIQAGLFYDKRNIESFRDTFNVNDIDAMLGASAVYAISQNVDLQLRYERAFIPGPPPKSVVNFGLETKIHF